MNNFPQNRYGEGTNLVLFFRVRYIIVRPINPQLFRCVVDIVSKKKYLCTNTTILQFIQIMGLLLVLIAIPLVFYILGSLVEFQDKQKEDRRQNNITKTAESNLSYKRFLEQRPFKKGLALVKLEEYRWCYLKMDGSYLNNRQMYFTAEEFDNNTVIVGILNDGYNIMDVDGKYLLPPLYDKRQSYYVKRITTALYSVSIRTEIKKDTSSYQYHIYREDGQRLNPEPLSAEPKLSNGWFTIKVGDKTTKMDENGKLESPLFITRDDVGDSLFIVSKDSKYNYGLYDGKNDRLILPCKYESLFYCKDYKTSIVRVRIKEGVWEKGKCVVQPVFRNRIIDLSGHTLYETDEEFCSVVDGKFILTRKAGTGSRPLFGAVFFDGTVIFKTAYHRILVNDSGSLFFALADNHCYVSNKAAQVVSAYGFNRDQFDMGDTITIFKHIYPSIYLSGEGAIGVGNAVQKRAALSTKHIAIIVCSPAGKKGVLSLENEVIIPIEFDSIKQIDDKNDNPIGVIVEKDGKFGALTLYGKTIIPIKYANLSYDYEHSESYEQIYDFSESTDFYDDMRKHRQWEQWKSGRTRLLVVKNKQGSIVRRFTVDGKPYEDDPDVYIEVPSAPNKASFSHNPKTRSLFEEKNFISTKYLFFDTETTGLPKNYNAPSSDVSNWPRLVQLSWILSDNKDTILSNKDYIIKPSGFTIPISSSSVHGITTEFASQNGVELSYAVEQFLADFEKSDIVVGHNIGFDKKVLGAELIRLGKSDILNNKRSICTMQSSVDYCKIPGLYGYKYPKLQELYTKLFGRPFKDAHNSAADIAATVECFWEMRNRGLL